MIDPFGRHITYLRVSVTDRCDLRCAYCMPARMRFAPKADVMSLEELDRICSAFVARGVRKLRITGGEPLVRRDVLTLIERLGRLLDAGALDELTLTTNGTRLAKFADRLTAAGVRRINVSIDSLNADRYRRITRGGDLGAVLRGLDAAQAAGMKVKLNAVALRNDNADELQAMIEWAHGRGMDFTLIEIMPLGEVESDRLDQYLPLSELRARLEKIWTLTDLAHRTGGPARYVKVEETGGRLGFITPLTQNFCEGCNRVRLTCTGQLYMCLGQTDRADLKAVLRAGADDAALGAAIDAAIARKPLGHEFVIDRGGRAPALARHMSMTGG